MEEQSAALQQTMGFVETMPRRLAVVLGRRGVCGFGTRGEEAKEAAVGAEWEMFFLSLGSRLRCGSGLGATWGVAGGTVRGGV